jgi:hypothetical protein
VIAGTHVSPTPSRFADAVRAEGVECVAGGMTTRLRVLDDGAWLSVDDTRRVSVSELWRLDAPGFCECDIADLVVENFLAVGVDGRTVTAHIYGQCIVCGTKSTVEGVPVGRILDGEFVDIDRDGVLSVRRTPPGEPAHHDQEKISG